MARCAIDGIGGESGMDEMSTGAAGAPGRWTVRCALWLMLAAALLLGGCASTVTTEVTAFRHMNWQDDPPRTYAFERASAQQAAELDRQAYQQWLAQALAGVGFEQVPAPRARYRVSMDYDAVPGTMRVQETVYPDPWYGPWGPYWGPWRGGYGAWGPWGGPWGWPGYYPPQTVLRDVPVTYATLRVYFRDARTGERVYQVTAQNHSETSISLAALMPYMIRSAFATFPAGNGEPRQITLPVEKPGR